MTQNLRAFATAAGVLAATLGAEPAWAQKSGGILKMYDPDSPASMSILEEGTVFAEGPMMGVFNNLVMYDRKTVCSRLCPIWQPAGRGTRTGPS